MSDKDSGSITHQTGYDLWNEREKLNIGYLRFYRDSRHAFGTRFEVEKPSHDWPWMVAVMILAAVGMAVMLAKVAA